LSPDLADVPPDLRAAVAATLEAAGATDGHLAVELVEADRIRALNREHRGKDAPTDVLSFPLFAPEEFARDGGRTRPLARAGDGAERMLGDIVVSVDTAARQAADYDAGLDREVRRLLIHAVLHLAGHDHLEPAERAVMEAEERRLADAIGMPWPYLEAGAR
jgi:probable rRNA maturation factor